MASDCLLITCASDCLDPLPPVSFDLCAPEVNFGEIDAIYVTNVGQPLTDETDPVEWAARFAAVGVSKIIELHVIADKPAPEESEIVISRNVIVTGSKGHSLNVEIQQTNKINYEFLRSLECARKLLVWYRTSGGLLYGGAVGIEGSLKLNNIIPKSRKELMVFSGTFKWESKFSPCVTNSPI